MKRSSWQTLAQSVSKNTPIKHGLSGLTGIASNRSNKNHQDLIHSFFKQLETAAAPRATRLVAQLVEGEEGEPDTVNYELRDTDQEVLELPTHMSRFGLFNEFLRQHGWKNHYDAKNRILGSVKIKEDAVLDFDELPSWKSFDLY